jgi:hypothetical protein
MMADSGIASAKILELSSIVAWREIVTFVHEVVHWGRGDGHVLSTDFMEVFVETEL